MKFCLFLEVLLKNSILLLGRGIFQCFLVRILLTFRSHGGNRITSEVSLDLVNRAGFVL